MSLGLSNLIHWVPILAVGIRDRHIEGIKQVGEGYIIATVDEAVTEGE